MKKQAYDELITRIKNAKTHDELDKIEQAYIIETGDGNYDKTLINWYIKQRREQI